MASTASTKFLDLLEPIRNQLFRYARRAAWQAEDVPDILQETALAAWRSFSRFEIGTNFRAWVFQILVNTTFNFNKRRQRQREIPLEGAEVDLAGALEREAVWFEALGRPNVLAELIDDRIACSLTRLKDVERQCFLLKLLEDFSCKQIGEMLAIPVGTVMSHVHRARMKLREDLAAFASRRGLVRKPIS
ncbi:MAG: RNA polymerase sigma factor [Planctomycetota bacterium]